MIEFNEQTFKISSVSNLDVTTEYNPRCVIFRIPMSMNLKESWIRSISTNLMKKIGDDLCINFTSCYNKIIFEQVIDNLFIVTDMVDDEYIVYVIDSNKFNED